MAAKYARIGGKVRIVTPRVFVRVGYPLNQALVAEKFFDDVNRIAKELTKRAQELSLAARGRYGNTDGLDIGSLLAQGESLSGWAQNAIWGVSCAIILEREHFGGKERQLYEEDVTGIAGKVYTVIGRRMVHTGTRHPASGGYGYDGEYDYEPAYLHPRQTYCIYKLAAIHFAGKPLQINAAHCEKVIDAVA